MPLQIVYYNSTKVYHFDFDEAVLKKKDVNQLTRCWIALSEVDLLEMLDRLYMF